MACNLVWGTQAPLRAGDRGIIWLPIGTSHLTLLNAGKAGWMQYKPVICTLA